MMGDGVFHGAELPGICHVANKHFHKYLHYNGTWQNLNKIIHIRFGNKSLKIQIVKGVCVYVYVCVIRVHVCVSVSV